MKLTLHTFAAALFAAAVPFAYSQATPAGPQPSVQVVEDPVASVSRPDDLANAIAQALILQPPILLMDEAFSALDPLTRSGMQQLIKDLWRQSGTTIVFVTHNTREAVCLGTRVVALAGNGVQGSSVALDLDTKHIEFDSDEEEIQSVIERVECASQPGLVGMQASLVPAFSSPDF